VTITPFSSLREYFDAQASGDIVDAYTRLLVTAPTRPGKVNPAESEATEVLSYDTRPWLSRYLIGLHSSTNLSFKVTAGSFTATVPVATIDHVSTAADGENFTRVVYYRSENFPLFHVKRDGTSNIVSLRSSVRVSRQVQSGAAGAALSVAQNVIRLVAPQASVLTTLSAQSENNRATALDSAINKLFATNLEEDQSAEGDIRLWGQGTTVEFRIPRSEGDLSNPITVGTWTVSFDTPRPSIFSDIAICGTPKKKDDGTTEGQSTRCASTFGEAAKQAQSEAKPSDVLAFKLTGEPTDLDTMATYVKKQDWYTAGVKALSGKTIDSVAIATFCSSAKSSMASLDLNSIDQGIVLHAIIWSLSLTDDVSAAVTKEPKCGL